MRLHRLDLVFTLFDLLRFPCAEGPDDQADDEEGRRRQQQHAVRHIPAAVVDRFQDGDAKQAARAEQLTE